MNYRDYKGSGPGEYYHIYNRGNSKNDVFLNREDFSFFITRLRQNLFPDQGTSQRLVPLPEGSFSLLSYCLMPNHFHLLLRQNREIIPGKLMLKVCGSYSKYFNKRYERVGHVFQDQFKQITIASNEYLTWLSAYIHQNPKVAGIVVNPEDYHWSSYQDYLGLRPGTLCDKRFLNNLGIAGNIRSLLMTVLKPSLKNTNLRIF